MTEEHSSRTCLPPEQKAGVRPIGKIETPKFREIK